MERLISRDANRDKGEGHMSIASEMPPTPEWDLAKRVVASHSFARSAFLTNFLLYVCDRKLRGQEGEITEYQIGIQALGRSGNYNPGEDNIVRNYARILRKRLDEYFRTEGKEEPLRIVIPRGHYVPVFENNAKGLPTPVEESEIFDSPTNEVSSELHSRRYGGKLIWLLVSLLVISVGASLAISRIGRMRQSDSKLYERFWAQLFNSSRPSLVVAGDSGFAMLQEMTGQEVHLHDYVSGDIDERFATLRIQNGSKVDNFGPDRFSNYTSTADLRLIVGLAGLPTFQTAHPQIRYARDIRMDDLKHSNVVLIGGPRANPWQELIEPESAFNMETPARLIGQHLDERIILNKHPRPGELAEYSNQTEDGQHPTYTIISFVRSLDSRGWLLSIQGQNMAGTEAGGEFLLNRDAMGMILAKAQTKDGSVGPFELILETDTVGADAPGAHVVVERYTR